MKLWPYDSFVIDAKMSVETITEVLDNSIEPPNWMRGIGNPMPFRGTVTQDGFRIIRNINSRYAFLPIITGFFRTNLGVISITITMRLRYYVTGFMCVWFGFAAVATIKTFTDIFHGLYPMRPICFIPFGMLFFGWALMSGLFWLEANRAKKLLIEMFNGRLRSE